MSFVYTTVTENDDVVAVCVGCVNLSKEVVESLLKVVTRIRNV